MGQEAQLTPLFVTLWGWIPRSLMWQNGALPIYLWAECISICIYPLWGSLHALGTQKGTQKTAVQTRYPSRIECASDTRPATILPGMESH